MTSAEVRMQPADEDRDEPREPVDGAAAGSKAAARPRKDDDPDSVLEHAHTPVPSLDELRAAMAWAFEGEEIAAPLLDRFAEHARNPTCAACHARIDPIGFAFEHFDQIGAYRAEENGVAVDASGTLSGTGIEGSFEDTPELVALLARSPQAHACFARNVYRFASGSLEAGPEETFLSRWREMPRERRTSLVEMLVELVASESFVQRRETP